MFTASCLLPSFSFAQAPQAFKYQTIVRDNSGNILANHAVSFRISLLQGTSTGASVFTETQTATTNQFGLANLSIGLGTLVSGNFSTISWGTNNYFVEIEFDAAGGTNYTLMGTSQLLSVPYALYAQSSNAWSLTGNAGTVDGTNFIGTTDNIPFNIRVATQKSGRIDFDGNIANTFFGFQAGKAITSGISNTATGYAALAYNTSGGGNTAIGSWALEDNTTGNFNTAIGNSAGTNNSTGSGNVFLGRWAGVNEIGSNKLYIANSSIPLIYGDFSLGFVGINTITPAANLELDGASGSTIKIVDGNQGAGKVLTSDGTGQGSWQTPSGGGGGDWALLGNAGTVDGTNFIGTTDNVPFNIRVNNAKAGRIEQTHRNAFYGYQAGNSNTIGYGNTANGFQALFTNTDANENTAYGAQTLYSNANGFQNTAVGSVALKNNTDGYYNTALGADALYSNTTGHDNTASGENALYYTSTGSYNIATGGLALNGNIAGNNATAIGYDAMQYSNNTATPFDNYNVAVGYQALMGSTTPANNTGNANTALGYQSLSGNTAGDYNTASGFHSLTLNTTGTNNTANGAGALQANTTGNGNEAVGTVALHANISGNNNTANGYGALYANTTGDANTADGENALANTISGINNTALGYSAGFNSIGNANVFLGYSAGYNETGSNKLYIANGSTNPPLIYGDFSAGNVGIGTITPGAMLEVEGQVKITGGTPGPGKVLTSDALGLATWQTPSGGPAGWGITGNAGTTPATSAIGIAIGAGQNYVGTTDAKDFVAGTNNLERMRITSAGNIGIGTITPNSTAALHVELGSSTSNGVLVSGTYNAASTVPSLGAGSRMMFYPGKAAFRAGYVSGTQWDNSNVGNYSAAIGANNTASGNASTAMGFNNIASGIYSTAMGVSTTASGHYSTAMGYSTTATGDYSTALGNATNASGSSSTALGNGTNATGSSSTALGWSTSATGDYSTTMGYMTYASGDYSTSMGSYVSTIANAGAFIIGDNSTTTITSSSVANEMTMRFAGGYRLFSNSILTAGVTLAAGGGAWASVSDKRKKENFISLNPEEVLLKIKNIPVTEWNYKAQDKTNHHIGPMAQDFYAAFELSGIGNDTTITTTDIDGVNMIAIQALEKRTAQLKLAQEELTLQTNELKLKTNELEKLKAEVESVKKESSEFKNKFLKLENDLSAADEANKKVNSLLERLNKLERNTQESASAKK